MLCRAFRLFSRQDCTEALLRNFNAVCAAAMAPFWDSWPVTASSIRYVIGPALMTLSRLGQAVARVFGAPYYRATGSRWRWELP